MTVAAQQKILVLLIANILLGGSVYAATPVSSGQTAGAEETRARKEGFYEKAALSSVKNEKDVIEANEKPTPKEEGLSRFLMKDIRFAGNESVPAAELRRTVEGFLNKEVDLNDLNDIAAAPSGPP